MSAADASCFADHPRSRGVYACPRNQSATRFGSSPLARGLRHLFYSVDMWQGIIPARAGFTPDRP